MRCERGVERGCRSIQFFNQSPRAWRPRVYSDEEVAAFHEAIDGSDVDALLIHAVYLLNCASEDEEIRDKSLTALTRALQAGAALGADGVVLHPGSALKGGGPVDEALDARRRRRSPRRSRSRTTARCTSRTPPAPAARSGARSRSSRALIELAGGGKRLGVCLDSCHLLASGYDVRTAEGLAGVVDEFDSIVGLDRLALAALQRLGDAAGLQRRPPRATSAKARSAARAARRSSRSRASRGCR